MAFLRNTKTGTFTEREHLALLATISDVLLQKGVRLKLSRCSFQIGNAEISGHVGGHTGLRPSDKHVESDRKLTEPASGDEMVRHLVVVSFFSAFWDRFAEIAEPLYQELKRHKARKE